jgi:hypothetical protein
MRFFRLLAIGVVLLALVGGVLGTACAGAKGEQGPQGETGATGATGPAGSAGPQGPQGTQGIQGIQGLQGIQGEKGDTGMPGVGIAWRGEWSDSTVYSLNDGVGYQGSSYISKQDVNTNHLPTDPDWWDLWVQKGTTGEPGPQGLQGEVGEQGPQGEQGIQGETGATGATGDTGAPGPNMIVAMGTVDFFGDLVQSYNVTSCVWDEDPWEHWEITLNGIAYSSDYVTLVTPYYNTLVLCNYSEGSDGQLWVVMSDPEYYTPVEYCGFSFTVLECPT